MRRCSTLISSDFVFENPSIEQLAVALVDTIEDALTDEDVLLPRPPSVPVHEIEEMQNKHRRTLSINSQELRPRHTATPVVLITGVTDGIGSHILTRVTNFRYSYLPNIRVISGS